MSEWLLESRRKEREEFARHAANRGRDWGPDGEWAFLREAEVRDALAAADPQISKLLKTHPRSVTSSYSPRGRAAGYGDPDWRRVLVFTEDGIGDPYEYAHVHKAFDRALKTLDKLDPDMEWSWDSINPAVHAFRVEAIWDAHARRSKGRDNPPRVYRAQKVIAQLQKETRPEFKKGMVVTDPKSLVEDTLSEYLAERATEVFLLIFVNIRNQVVGFNEYGSGSTSGVEVSAAGIMRDALLSGAAGVITIHNHPTGDPTPSADDRALWERLKAAGTLIGIPVVDNLVVGESTYFSESEGHVQRYRAPAHREST